MRRSPLLRVLASIMALAFAAVAAEAADPQPYRVDFAATHVAGLDETLEASSDLKALRDSAPVSPAGLIARARGDIDRLTSALESFGYYRCAVLIKIDGLPLDDLHLGETLSALPAGRAAQVSLAFDLGPVFHLRRIDVEGDLPGSLRGKLGLVPGQPAVATDVLAGGQRLQSAIQEEGYPFAKVDPPIAYQDEHEPVLDLTFHAETGRRATVGEVKIEGLKAVHESLVRARLLLHTGERYSAGAIERARADLLGLGVFAAVNVKLGEAVDASGRIDVTFQLRESLRHALGFNVAYSSDLGGSGGVTWTDRNLFGDAQRLRIAASLINLGGSDTTGIGYDTSAKYSIPDVWRRDQSVDLSLGALKQNLQAYEQTSETSGVTLNRRLSSVWTANIGVSMSHESIIQEGATRDYNLLALPLGLNYDSTGTRSLLEEAVHGVRASFSVVPTRALGSAGSTFLITQVKVAGYLDLHAFGLGEPGRSVLAARALAGLAQGAGEFSLPPDQRFYGGGSGTIRGYRYQAVGPQFADGNPIGGTAIAAGSLELRQRFGTRFGAAFFVDGGQVSASLKALPNVLRFGVGAGFRYFTPIGPIRLDFAVPTQRGSGDDAFEVYVGLGEAF